MTLIKNPGKVILALSILMAVLALSVHGLKAFFYLIMSCLLRPGFIRDRLPNGNAYISEDNTRRLFQVKPDKTIVWGYMEQGWQ